MPEMTKDDIITHLEMEIGKAKEVADIESTENAKLYKYYRAKTMDNEVAGRSQLVDTTVFETVEWIMPALEDIFSEENGNPEFEPQGPEDEIPAEMMTQLCRYQFWRQSEGVVPLRQAMKKGLLFRPGGVIKYCWEKDVSSESKQWEGVPPDLMLEMGMMGDKYEAKTIIPREDGSFDVDGIQRSVEYDGPRFYSVPDGEFLRHPNTKDIKTSPFVAHRTKVTADWLRRQKGKPGWIDAKIDEVLADHAPGGMSSTEITDSESTMAQQDNLGANPEFSTDPARKEFTMYECYVQMDADGDGLLENRVMNLIDKVLMRDAINEYKYPPFIRLCSIDDIDKFSQIPISEYVMDIQRLRTAVIRQMVDNNFQANNSRKVYDPSVVSQADLFNNVPGGAIRVEPGVDVRTAITELVTQPFSPVTFSLLEYATNLAEQRTGITKSNKGVGDQYNETFHGQMAALNQASQRIRMIAKIMATGLSDLFRAMVYMNKKFMTESTYIRLNNKFVPISPDDLEGRMDLILHVIMGQSSRQQTLVNMQTLLATLGQMQQVGIPALDAKVSKTIITEMAKSMGYKASDRFVADAFLNNPAQVSQMMTANSLMGGNGGAGGSTMASTANTGTGATATPNPTGSGVASPAIQPGAGAVLQ
jgi:hypothetical protein